MLKDIIKKFFMQSQWQTIYDTQDVEKYLKIKGKLINNNIGHKTKIINQGGGGYSRRRYPSTYKILVKESDVQRANKLI